jgi:hypothetical protein
VIRNVAWALAASLLVLGGSSLGAETPEAAPLDNEQVVRMVADGTPEAAILEAIRTRPPAFDVADDMVDELKLAGVPASVIAAMKARMARLAPSPPPEERPPRGTVPLVVTINGGSQHTLHAPAFADEELKHQLQLPKENADREVKDLAVFLACTTAEHVPDLWRQKSPLGRDMNAAFRHEMLAFVAGDTPAGKKPRLTLPARLEANVDDVEAHALVVGVAARIGDRWMVLAASEPVKTVISAKGAPLAARITGTALPFGFKASLEVPKAPARP